MNIDILFDGGGTRDMEAYGSYRIITSGGDNIIRREVFGNGYTNNEAEYMTLIAALETTLSALDRKGIAPFDVELTISGDSELVRNQIGTMLRVGITVNMLSSTAYNWTGWKVNVKHLLPLRDKARGLLEKFYTFDYKHIPRKEVVKVLGH